MIEEKRIAEVKDYNGLIAALRARKTALGLTDALVDELANLARGHCGKLLGAAKPKHLGPLSFGAMLGTLAVKLIVVEDPDALAQMQGHYEKRVRSRARMGNHARPLGMRRLARKHRATFLEAAKRGGKARMAKMTPEQRRRHQQHAARARWAKRAKASRPRRAAVQSG